MSVIAHSPDHQRLIRQLDAISVLGAEDRDVLATLPLNIRSITENSDIVSRGDRPSSCCLILEGFTCRYNILASGQRQIFSFHVPGDIPDLQSLHIEVMDHSLGALTPCRVAFIPHAAIDELLRTRPRIARAFWRETLIDAAIFREWLASVGRRTAYQSVAHLICEIYVQLLAVGLAGGLNFELPITQEELGDALGLSAVHINRVLQELKVARVIASNRRQIVIIDWERLKAAGDFDPGYLHLRHDEL